MVMPGSLCGKFGLSIDFGVDIGFVDLALLGVLRLHRGDSRWRTMLRGVRGESNRVNLRRRRAAIGDDVGEVSGSATKPQPFVPCDRAGESIRRLRRASFSGDGEANLSKFGRIKHFVPVSLDDPVDRPKTGNHEQKTQN